MSIQHESRLDRELDTLLQHLGVRQETQNSPLDLHMTCLYSDMDHSLWKSVQQHLACVKHPTNGAICWHAHDISPYREAWRTKHILEDLRQTHLILLFISIDLMAVLSDQAEEIYHALIATLRREQPARIIVVAARPTAWYDDYLVDLPRAPRKGTLATMRHAELGYVEVARAVQQAINDLVHSSLKE